MKLNFLGRGAAFNTKEGNNSAYFIDNNQLFLIDCGESVFERIRESGILDKIEKINIMITHTHSDHVGSLGSLVAYFYYKLNKPLNIISSSNAKHLSDIEILLRVYGCDGSMYNFVDEKNYDNKFNSFNSIRYVETKHCDVFHSYGLLFNTLNGVVYYSGDTREIDIVKSLIDKGVLIDKLYVDTTTDDYPGNVHLYIGILKDVIPEELKSRVYCMHINNDECIKQAKKLGFNVVEVEKTNEKVLKKTHNN